MTDTRPPVATLRLAPGQPRQAGSIAPGTPFPRRGPLVSCLMVTRGGLYPAAHAIACFQRQSYVDRELVVLCDRPAPALAGHVAAIGDPAIRFVAAEPAPLGTLRNVSVAQARGDIVCQWDDDDLYHSDRIGLMVSALSDEAIQAAFLLRWTIWWPARRTIAFSGRRVWEGTMLARRAALPPYPARAIDEDRPAITQLIAAHPVMLIDQPLAYCYVVHGANTYDTPHFEEMLGWATRVVEGEAYGPACSNLSGAFPFAAYAASLEPR